MCIIFFEPPLQALVAPISAAEGYVGGLLGSYWRSGWRLGLVERTTYERTILTQLVRP